MVIAIFPYSSYPDLRSSLAGHHGGLLIFYMEFRRGDHIADDTLPPSCLIANDDPDLVMAGRLHDSVAMGQIPQDTVAGYQSTAGSVAIHSPRDIDWSAPRELSICEADSP